MKFRAVPQTELVVSEVGFSLASSDDSEWIQDDVVFERRLRLAYDSGITLFDVGPVNESGGWSGVFSKSFSAAMRRNLILAAVLGPALGDKEIEPACDRFLRQLNTDVLDLCQFENPPGRIIQSG